LTINRTLASVEAELPGGDEFRKAATVGLLDRLHERHAEHERERAQAAYQAALVAWQRDETQLRDFLEATTQPGGRSSATELKASEGCFLDYNAAALVEPRREPGHYTGGYSGFSFRIAKGVRYHVGGTRGTYVPGPENPTAIDSGTLTITDRRVVFRGIKQAREWTFEKMLGYHHDEHAPVTYVQVSNRQKVSGFVYDVPHIPLVRFSLALALAHYHGAIDDLRHQLEEELHQHQAERPAPVALVGSTPA